MKESLHDGLITGSFAGAQDDGCLLVIDHLELATIAAQSPKPKAQSPKPKAQSLKPKAQQTVASFKFQVARKPRA